MYTYTKKSCPSQIFVHQTWVCCVFFISDLPISSTNTPDNSPLAPCDDSKFQDIEKQLRDSDKNPVGCIGWWVAECLNSLGDRVFQPTKRFFFGFFPERWKLRGFLGPQKTPMFSKMRFLAPLFFSVRLPSQFSSLPRKVSWSSITSPSRLGDPANRWRDGSNPQHWQVRNPPFFLGVLVGAFLLRGFSRKPFWWGLAVLEFFVGFEGCSLFIERFHATFITSRLRDSGWPARWKSHQ